MQHRLLYLRLFICLAVAGIWMTAGAQKSTGYETISTADGLSQGMIFDLLQDADGFIWIATKNGLNRYDGYGFKVFTNDPYESHSLSSNTVVKLFEDSKGRIWVGTDNAGLNIYDKVSGQFFRIARLNVDADGLSGNEIKSMEELPGAGMLVATDMPGLNLVETGNDFFTKGSAARITRLSLPNGGHVYGMGKDARNNVWIGGMDGLVYRFDVKERRFMLFPGASFLNNGYRTTDGHYLIGGQLYLYHKQSITPLFDTARIPAGNLVFKPNRALWDKYHREPAYYDISRFEAGRPPVWEVNAPDSTRLLYPFFIDRSGILWSGSVGYGLRKYNPAGSKFRAQLPGFSVRFIVPVSDETIYLGDFGYGWRKIQAGRVTNDPFNIIPSVTQPDNFVLTSGGDFWIKSDNKGYFKFSPATGKLTAYPYINYYNGNGEKQPMKEDSQRRLWIPGLGGRIFLHNPETEKTDSFSINTNSERPMPAQAIITALFEDNQGIFWIGTKDGFAKCSMDRATGMLQRVDWYYADLNNRHSLNYNNVSCFLEDPTNPEKHIWIGTKGGGLNRLDKSTGRFTHLTAKKGLPDDVVYALMADETGNIWGSTNKGIFCLQPAKENDDWAVRSFTKADGLQDNEFNTGAAAKLPNGYLAFGGVNGVNIFNPSEILTTGFMPRVFITDILVNNQAVSSTDNPGVIKTTIEKATGITLTHLQDILTLEFSSLDFTAPAQNKYRYKMVGVDNNWVESGTRRSATYLHLPAGKYVFTVQGSNSQGIWSPETAELSITVLPPWWRSWWAYSVYALLLVLGIWGLFRFLIKREKLTSQLNMEQLEARRIRELDTVKSQLYTNITHEFRTPLTVILGMARQVKENPDKHSAHGLDMIIRNGQSLLTLVNDMLDLSKLETGKMGLQLVQGDIIHFLRYIAESFHSLADSQAKQLHFLSDADALHCSYDPEKIRQIVGNLLSNALKYTAEKGNIYLSVSQQELAGEEGNIMLTIRVKDTGIGIPEDQLQHVFERFYRLDNSHTRKTEGSGIGLALTRELVRLMNGDITVKSPPFGSNKGTEFTVQLPLTRIPASEAQDLYPAVDYTGLGIDFQPADTSSGAVGNNPLILLVEDNADVVAYTASCLTDYRLAVGKDGREGFDIATELIPDLIVTDVMMPFIDGFELCSKLKKDERTSHIPIIMLTAKAGIDSKLEGLQHGADAYLEKPFNRDELLLRIKKMLESRKSLQQYYLRQAGINTGSAPAKDSPIHQQQAVLEDTFVGRVREIVEENLRDSGFSVEQLCKKVFMSHSQLHRKLDALTGLSPNKYIRMIRLNKAKQLMKIPGNSIATIAYECGYNDPGYFARVFKQEFGETPQEWRSKQ